MRGAQARRSKARGPYGVGIERRRRIVQAAHELFSVQGYRGTPLRDVAAKADLSLAGLLHYFPNKEALLEAVLSYRDETDIPWFEERWEETGTLRAALRELVVRNIATREVIQLFTTLSAEATDPAHPAHDYFQQRYRTSRELFASSLERAVERGEVRPGVSGPLLIAVLDGLQVQWLLEPKFDYIGELDRYLDLIMVPASS